ncbi:MAG TPA: HlyD family secretion protein [Bryobacteraceae bacterium]|nr:HlyD family secretion protein [Bryobacteraceae bacterium]
MEIYDEEPEDLTESKKRRRPRSRTFLYTGGVLLVLALAGAALWLHMRNRESTDDAQVNGHISPISSKISGTVLDVLVNDNQSVKAGQVLLRLDPRDYQVRVDQAQAELATAESKASAARQGVPLIRSTTSSGTSGAEAELAAAEAQYRQAQVAAEQARTSGVAVAEANVVTARARNEKAQADLERMRPLIAKQEISQQQFDSYVAAARVTESQLQAAQEQANAARQNAAATQAAEQSAAARVGRAQAGVGESRANQQQVNVTAAQAQSAGAAVQQARANLEAAKLQLSYTTIVAPTDGVVTEKNVEPGQIVAPGQGLMAVVPLNSVWVTANFKETQLAHVKPGQTVEVKVDMYGQTIQGRVDSIAGATGARMSLLPPENATGNFVKVVQRIPVKIVFDKLPPGVVLRPGMNVDATILTK